MGMEGSCWETEAGCDLGVGVGSGEGAADGGEGKGPSLPIPGPALKEGGPPSVSRGSGAPLL